MEFVGSRLTAHGTGCMSCPLMPRNETLLSAIDDLILSLECTCGHRATLAVAEPLPKVSEEAAIQDVVDRSRCRACDARGANAVPYVRIVYANQQRADPVKGRPNNAVT